MPKTKGMTSIEVAIIVAIVLVIAIAVGWYLYTTFSSASQQTGLAIRDVTIQVDKQTGKNPYLLLKVASQGTAQAQILRIEVGNDIYDCSNSPIIIDQPYWVVLSLSKSEDKITVGQTLSGRVILTTGTPVPFTAVVRAVDSPSTPPDNQYSTKQASCS